MAATVKDPEIESGARMITEWIAVGPLPLPSLILHEAAPALPPDPPQMPCCYYCFIINHNFERTFLKLDKKMVNRYYHNYRSSNLVITFGTSLIKRGVFFERKCGSW